MHHLMPYNFEVFFPGDELTPRENSLAFFFNAHHKAGRMFAEASARSIVNAFYNKIDGSVPHLLTPFEFQQLTQVQTDEILGKNINIFCATHPAVRAPQQLGNHLTSGVAIENLQRFVDALQELSRGMRLHFRNGEFDLDNVSLLHYMEEVWRHSLRLSTQQRRTAYLEIELSATIDRDSGCLNLGFNQHLVKLVPNTIDVLHVYTTPELASMLNVFGINVHAVEGW